MGGLAAIAAILIEIAPHAIKGVSSAIAAFDAGKGIYDRIKGEGRDATEAEVQSVRALWQHKEDDFMTDDEAQP